MQQTINIQTNSSSGSIDSTLQRQKSAFTPLLPKPVAIKTSPLNLFEPSPISKLLYISALAAQHQQQHEAPTKAFNIAFTPTKIVTPSQFLNIGGQQLTPSLVRQASDYPLTSQFLINAPTSFNYDVIVPSKSLLRNSPLRDVTMTDNLCFSSDQDNSESTQESQAKHEEIQSKNQTEKKNKKALNINGILIDDFLASDNLNECVDFLLRKHKLNPNQTFNKIIRHNASGKSKEKRRRYRKNGDQHHILLNYFEKNPNWDKQQIQKLSDELGLKESQIYKWNWDMRKKLKMIEPDQEE